MSTGCLFGPEKNHDTRLSPCGFFGCGGGGGGGGGIASLCFVSGSVSLPLLDAFSITIIGVFLRGGFFCGGVWERFLAIFGGCFFVACGNVICGGC